MAFSNTGRLLSNYYFVGKSCICRLVLLNDVFNVGMRSITQTSFPFSERPKRPLCGFLRFYQKISPELKAKYPKSTLRERKQKASCMWDEMNLNDRLNLVFEYGAELKEYMKQLDKYNSNLSDEERNALIKIEQRKLERRKKRKTNKDACLFGKPLKPLSPTILFIKSFNENLNTFYDIIALSDYQKYLEMWNKLSTSEKRKFELESEALKKKYVQDMIKWEEKMINEGRTYLLSKSSRIDIPTKLEINSKSFERKKQGRPMKNVPRLIPTTMDQVK